MRPADRILDLGEDPRAIRRRRQSVQELAHQVCAPIVEALDLAVILHRVLRRVVQQQRWAHGARHRLTIAFA